MRNARGYDYLYRFLMNFVLAFDSQTMASEDAMSLYDGRQQFIQTAFYKVSYRVTRVTVVRRIAFNLLRLRLYEYIACT